MIDQVENIKEIFGSRWWTVQHHLLILKKIVWTKSMCMLSIIFKKAL